ncbi:MAG: sigma-54-dependent transcriptional regulator [Myxococcota bacterium]
MTIQILIVDDESSNRQTLKRVLSREGYVVSTAENAAFALAQVRQNPPELMLTDIKMPGMDGIELLKQAKKVHPLLEVIVMTAYGTVEQAVEAMKEGAWDFIAKPIKRAELIRAVRKALEKQALSQENRALRSALERSMNMSWVYRSPSMQMLTEEAKQIADSEANVMILGESGTGKGRLAKWIHQCSNRHNAPFITVNCGAIPEALIESELFGHEKGAFTGASSTRQGRFELANHGILFLDEFTEMPIQLQVKLLRVLQDGEFERIGGQNTIKVDVRVLAASNRQPLEAVQAGQLREDLYYRLNVIQLQIPALRNRKDDIPLLVHHFMAVHADRNRRQPKSLSQDAMTALLQWDWPGNVRELENAIERALILSKTEDISLEDLPASIRAHSPQSDCLTFVVGTPLKLIEREMIEATLMMVDGDKAQAAALLGITQRTIYRKEAEWKGDK